MEIVILVLIVLSVLGFPLLQVLMAGLGLVIALGMAIGAMEWLQQRLGLKRKS